jgi:hypothetical protein
MRDLCATPGYEVGIINPTEFEAEEHAHPRSMKTSETSQVFVVLQEDAVVPWWAPIPRLCGPNSFVMHPTDAADIAGGVEDSPCRIVEMNSFRKLRASVELDSRTRELVD